MRALGPLESFGVLLGADYSKAYSSSSGKPSIAYSELVSKCKHHSVSGTV